VFLELGTTRPKVAKHTIDTRGRAVGHREMPSVEETTTAALETIETVLALVRSSIVRPQRHHSNPWRRKKSPTRRTLRAR
jgi:hypothetical protein